jgi:hypothetical protein
VVGSNGEGGTTDDVVVGEGSDARGVPYCACKLLRNLRSIANLRGMVS